MTLIEFLRKNETRNEYKVYIYPNVTVTIFTMTCHEVSSKLDKFNGIEKYFNDDEYLTLRISL